MITNSDGKPPHEDPGRFGPALPAQAVRLAACAVEGYDLLIIAGDLLDMGGFASIDAQIVVVLKYMQQLQERIPLLVCSGATMTATKRTRPVSSSQPGCAAYKASGCGSTDRACRCTKICTPRAGWREGPVSRQDVEQLLEQERAQAPRKCWMWLYHAPPDASPLSWTGSRHYGDAFLRGVHRVRHRPDFVFGGHIHNAPFTKEGSWIDRIGDTWLFNPGHQIGDFPTHISIDLDTMRARWVAFDRTDERDLTAAS